jgi:hypothetical protein
MMHPPLRALRHHGRVKTVAYAFTSEYQPGTGAIDLASAVEEFASNAVRSNRYDSSLAVLHRDDRPVHLVPFLEFSPWVLGWSLEQIPQNGQRPGTWR